MAKTPSDYTMNRPRYVHKIVEALFGALVAIGVEGIFRFGTGIHHACVAMAICTQGTRLVCHGVCSPGRGLGWPLAVAGGVGALAVCTAFALCRRAARMLGPVERLG